MKRMIYLCFLLGFLHGVHAVYRTVEAGSVHTYATGLVAPGTMDLTASTTPLQSSQNVSLPPALDWRESIAFIPVRDQLGCGSCWAFATVGTVEFAFARAFRFVLDISEQASVSCNGEGYSCASGGWWVFSNLQTHGLADAGPWG